MLATEMYRTAANAKIPLDPLLASEFDRLFGSEPIEALRWAWGVWRARSPYFPAICDIVSLLRDFHRSERGREEEAAKREERRLLEDARKKGLVPEFADTVRELKAVLSAVGEEPEHVARMRRFKERIARAAAAVGTLDLSDEQIQSRRQRERAEIARYSRHSDDDF